MINKKFKLEKIITDCILFAIAIGCVIFIAHFSHNQDKQIAELNNQITELNKQLESKDNALSYYKEKLLATQDFNKNSINKMIDEIAPQYNIPNDFAKTIIENESNFDPAYNLNSKKHAGVASLTANFAKDNGFIVNKDIDERITNPEKSLHLLFKNLDNLRQLIKTKTGEDSLIAAYTLQTYGINEYYQTSKRGKIQNSITNNLLISKSKMMRHYK